MSGRWERIEIDGKSADVFRPSNPEPSLGAMLNLHGHGEITLADNAAYSAELERHGLTCVCPHGRRSWWMNRICREFDPSVAPVDYLSNSVVPFIENQLGIQRPQIAVTGHSMGGHGAMYFAFQHPREFPVVAAISPAIDFQQLYGAGLPLDEMFSGIEEIRQETIVLNLHPLNWPRHMFFCCDPDDVDWFPGSDRLAMKLGSSGIMYECDLETRHGGHSWEYFDHMAHAVVGFVAERLDQVRRQAV